MNEYRLADIQAGKIQNATFHAHGFNLDFYEHTPGKSQTLSGTHLSQAEYQALIDNKVPIFHFEEKGASNMPIMKGAETHLLPWSSSSRITSDIGNSILAMTSDKHFNFEPLKIPLSLFTQAHQERLIQAAEKHGTQNMLVEMAIPNSERYFEDPVRYYEEVISKEIPDSMLKLTNGVLQQIKDVDKKAAAMDEKPDVKTDEKLRNDRWNLEKQKEFLRIHMSKINEAVLIGKANDWAPAKTLNYAKEKISELNIRAKDVVKEQKREASPMDYARAEIANKLDGIVTKLFKIMEESFAYTR